MPNRLDTGSRRLARFCAASLPRRWTQSQREAIEATRQSIAEMQRARNLADIMRVQQDWLAGTWQHLAADFQALTSLALQRRTK